MSKPRQAMVCGRLCTAPDGDYFVVCSFDSNHILLRSRLPYHILKCERNHPGHNKLQCPYDATEYLDRENFASHILTCESRRSISTGKYETAALKASGNMCNIKQTPFFHEHTPDPEDWSEESPEKISEDYPFTQLTGVGRGVRLKKVSVKKGMGRAELISRFIKMHEEKQALSISASSSSSQVLSSSASSTSSRSAKDDAVSGQFDDGWED